MTLSTDDDVPWDDLTAWLAGMLPAAEVARLQEWIAGDAARAELVRTLRAIWDGAAAAEPAQRWHWDARTALAAIKAREASQPKVIPLPGVTMPRASAWPRRAKLIATAAAAAGLLLGGWWLTVSEVAKGKGRVPNAEMQAMRHYQTARGQRLAFKLPDGSGVILGPEGAVRYAASYGRHARIVELEGDASFEVVHDPARPFEVRTAHAVIRDLGTRFVVRARRAAPTVEVAVAHGRVALGGLGTAPMGAAATRFADSVVLAPGDWGGVTTTGAVVRRQGVELDRYFGWTEGRLVYRAADLTEVVAELNRWYDVDIRLADSTVGRLRLTATFHDQPITEVLASIQASLRLDLSGAGRHFTLAAR